MSTSDLEQIPSNHFRNTPMTSSNSFFAGGYTTPTAQRHLLIPDGTYEVRIVSAEERSKQETGARYLWIVYSVQVFGIIRLLPQIVMLRSSSPRAQETGRNQLGYLCAAVGLDRVSQPEDFLGRLLLVEVCSYIRTDTGVADNRVRRMLPITDSDAETDGEEDRYFPDT